MASTFDYIINIKTKGAIKGLSSFNASVAKVTNNFQKLQYTAFRFANIGDAFQNASDQLNKLVQPGIAFESQLKDLQAITGVADSQLKQLGQSARENAKIFGGDAGKSVESYKLLLSQLGPSIANSPKALEAMGKNVSILSKTMGNDATAATQVLTAAMNQFGVDLSKPQQAVDKMTGMMNIMAAAAKEGSAEMPSIKTALENVGAVAKNAGVSFAETNSAIQLLDKYGKKGAEGGVALRNVLATLAQGRFLPKDVLSQLKAAGVNTNLLTDKTKTLSERLQALSPIQQDSALMTKLFGKENELSAVALIQNTTQLDNLTGKIQNTTIATDQAKIVMSSYAERMSRLRARFSDLGISIFNATKQYLPLIQFSSEFLTISSRLTPLVQALGGAVFSVTKVVGNFAFALLRGGFSLLKFAGKLILNTALLTGQFIVSLFRASTYTNLFSKAQKIAGTVSLFFTKIQLQGSLMLGFLKSKLIAAKNSTIAYATSVKTAKFSLKGFIVNVYKSGLAVLKSAGRFIWSAVSGIGSYIASLVSATLAQIGLNVAMEANPIGLIVIGLLALGTAVYAIVKHWDVVKKWLWELAQFAIKMNPFYWLLKGIDWLFPGLKDKLSQWWDAIVGFFKKIGGWFSKIWNEYLAPILGLDDISFSADANYTDNDNSGNKMPDNKNSGNKMPNNNNNKTHYNNSYKTPDIPTSDNTQAGVNGINNGGSRPTNINITLDKLNDTINVYAQTVKESGSEIEKQMQDFLLRVINSANAISNG